MNYAQKTLLLGFLLSSTITSLLLLAFLNMDFSSTTSIVVMIALCVIFLIAGFLGAVFFGQRITRKIFFEGRLRSRLRNLRQSLADNTKKHHALSDHLFEAILVTDEQFRITYANKTAKKILARSSLHKLSLAEIIREPEIHEIVTDARENHISVEKVVNRGSGQKFLLKAFPVGDDVALLLFDITRIFNEERHKDFVAHASHELKTPISIILANAEMLIDGFFDDNAKSIMVQSIARQATRAKKLVESMLELSRIDAGQLDIVQTKFPLAQLVDDVKNSLGHVGTMIKNDISEEFSLTTDRDLIERVMLILAENTHKYAGERASLHIRAHESRKKTVIEFVDNGPGIKSHLRERVFEKFYRQPEHIRADKDGFGLGLSHARAIVNSLGGRIFVDDKVKPGCAIVLVFESHV